MTDIQFRKSPTGEKSNLSEEQWRFLYDKENEELFKNWEVAAAFKYATEGKPVAELSGKEFQKAEGESVINNVLAYYTDIFDNRVFREGIGDVILDKKGIKDSVAHGLSREKAVAFAAVPKIIEKGIVFDRQENWKGRKYDTCVLIAPITIAGKKYAEEVVLRQNTKTNKFYLHEVELNEKLLELFKTPTERSSPKSYLIITKHLEEVKNCSVEIGDNFEPKSDYIQTIIEKHIMANKNKTLSSVQSDAQKFADSLNDFFVEHKDSPDAEPDLYSANFNPGLLEIPVDENGFTDDGAWFELFMNLKDGLSFSISKINPDNTTDFNYQEKLSDYGKQIFEAAKPLMKERLRAEIEKGKQFDSIINGKDGGMRAFYAASEYAAHLNKEKNMENEAVNVSDEEINKLTNVIKNKTYMTVQNPELKEVVFNYGDFGNLTTLKSEGGNGIIHIIQRRAEIDKLSANDISSLLIKIFELSKTTKPDKYDSTRIRAFIEKDGIKVILQKNWNGTDKNWLVSGYGIIGDNKKLTLEAAETIKTVNALYGYKPEHSRLRIQVGAVIASIQTVRQNQLKVKTEKNKIFVENTKKQISTKNAKTVYDKAILNQPLNLVSDSLLKTAYTSSVYANYILTNFPDSELLLKAKNLRLIELSGNKELIEKYKNELHFRGYSFENNITRNFAEVFFHRTIIRSLSDGKEKNIGSIKSADVEHLEAEINKEKNMKNESLSRRNILEGKQEITEKDIESILLTKHEYPVMDDLEVFTNKKYSELESTEKKQLIEDLLNADYLKYKNCFLSRTKLLYDSAETLKKEIEIIDKLNNLGYEIYLLPYGFARDSMNCFQKSADSITYGEFLEFKSVISTSKHAGKNVYKDARKQAKNVFISVVNETSEEKIINNIYGAIKETKKNNEQKGITSDFEGLVFLNFEKLNNKTILYNFDKDGYAIKLDNPTFDYFKKIEGIVTDSQVEENPRIEPGSSPIENVTETNRFVNQTNKKSQLNKTADIENEVKTFVGSINNLYQESDNRFSMNVSFPVPLEEEDVDFVIFTEIKDDKIVDFELERWHKDGSIDYDYQDELSEHAKEIFEASEPFVKKEIDDYIAKVQSKFDTLITNENSQNKFIVTESVTFPCNFTFPADYKDKSPEEHKKYVSDFVKRMNTYYDFGFGDEYETEIFTDKNGDDFNVNFTLQVPENFIYPDEKAQEWKKHITEQIENRFSENNPQVVFDEGNSLTKTFDSEEKALEYVKDKTKVLDQRYDEIAKIFEGKKAHDTKGDVGNFEEVYKSVVEEDKEDKSYHNREYFLQSATEMMLWDNLNPYSLSLKNFDDVYDVDGLDLRDELAIDIAKKMVNGELSDQKSIDSYARNASTKLAADYLSKNKKMLSKIDLSNFTEEKFNALKNNEYSQFDTVAVAYGGEFRFEFVKNDDNSVFVSLDKFTKAGDFGIEVVDDGIEKEIHYDKIDIVAPVSYDSVDFETFKKELSESIIHNLVYQNYGKEFMRETVDWSNDKQVLDFIKEKQKKEREFKNWKNLTELNLKEYVNSNLPEGIKKLSEDELNILKSFTVDKQNDTLLYDENENKIYRIFGEEKNKWLESHDKLFIHEESLKGLFKNAVSEIKENIEAEDFSLPLEELEKWKDFFNERVENIQQKEINAQCENNLLGKNPYATECLLDDINEAKSTGENLFDGITKDNVDVFSFYATDLAATNIQVAYADNKNGDKQLYFRNTDEDPNTDFIETPLSDLYKFAKDSAERDIESHLDIIEKEGNFKKLAEIFKDSEIIQNAYYKSNEYTHSEEFIQKFGDWEKANRIEKLKAAESLILNNQIIIGGKDKTLLISELRKNPSPENLKKLNILVSQMGKEILQNLRLEQNIDNFTSPVLKIADDEKTYKFNFQGIKEVSHHNLYQKGHIEGIYNIPEIIQSAIYIGTEKNEDNRKPELKQFHYYAQGIKFYDEDYTAKVVFTENKNGEVYYDQSLSTIEKGKLIDIIQQKNRLETFNPQKRQNSFEPNLSEASSLHKKGRDSLDTKNKPEAVNPINRRDSSELLKNESPSTYYDKRLINICQVPQMPYLEMVNGKWQPTQEAIKAVREGTLSVEKRGQNYIMKDSVKLNEEELNAGIISQDDQKSMDRFLDYLDSYAGGEFEGVTKENVKVFVEYANILESPKESGTVKWSIAENADGNPQLYLKDADAEVSDWRKASLVDMYKMARDYLESDMMSHPDLVLAEGELPDLLEIFKDSKAVQAVWNEMLPEDKRVYSECKKYIGMNPSDRSILESFYDDAGNYHNDISFFDKGHINYLLNHNMDLKPFVYFAATDAFLGDDLKNLLKVIPESEWEKIRSDKEWCADALKTAEESITNDDCLTISPTLEFAERLDMLPEAVAYCKNLANEVKPSREDLETYKEVLKIYEGKLNEKSAPSVATNYVLKKLNSAGIEVITDKEEFDRILQREEILQKMQGTLSDEEQKRYFTFNEEDTQKFIEQVDEWNLQKENNKTYNPGKLIEVGKIPPVMKVLGIAEVPISVQYSTLTKMVRNNPLYPNDYQGHKLSVDDIYAIPSQLADPVMVFKSRTRDDSFVFFTERKDNQNRTILIPLAVNKRKGRIVINEITSMYGRNNEVDFVKTNIDEGNLVYLDKKRNLEWERECKVQFLTQGLSQQGSNLNILTKERLVNFISADSRSNPIQKMTGYFSPENLFASNNKENLNSEIDSLTINDVNLQDEFIEISDKTPFIFKECGLGDFPVNMYKQKLARALFLEKEKYGERLTHGHKNEFTDKEIKDVFKNIGNPRYIFNSKQNLQNPAENYLIAVYDEFDKQGNPMMLSLHFNKNRNEIEANWVTSIYGKDKNILINDWTQKGFLIYKNDLEIEKAPAEVVTLYMRVSKSASAYKDNILLKSNFVNNLDLFLYAQKGETYGFTFENKIYLNPEIMNSNVAVHEYSHLWDEYTKRTNSELWNKGKNILKNTYLWNEIKNNPDYADIADNDDLFASEVHSRICGEIAQSVLERIAKENGEITKDTVVNWDWEVANYIAKEFSAEEIKEISEVKEFFTQPMKDLVGEKEITKGYKMEKNSQKENEINNTIHFHDTDVDENYFNEQVTNKLLPYFEEYNENCIDDSEKIKLTGVKFYGENEGQLKILVSYEGELSEDSLFNILNEAKADGELSYNGYDFDMNPIKPEKSGTIEEYLEFLKIRDFEENHGMIVKDPESGNILKIEPVAHGNGYMSDLFDKNQKFIDHDMFEEDDTLEAVKISISDYAKDNLWGNHKDYGRIKNADEYEKLWESLDKTAKEAAVKIEKAKNQKEYDLNNSDFIVVKDPETGNFIEIGLTDYGESYTSDLYDKNHKFIKHDIFQAENNLDAVKLCVYEYATDYCWGKNKKFEVIDRKEYEKFVENLEDIDSDIEKSKNKITDVSSENTQNIFDEFLSDVEKEYRELKLFRQATINVLKNLPEDKKEFVNQELLRRGANSENSLANVMKDAIQQKLRNERQKLNNSKSFINRQKKRDTDYDRER